MKMLKIKKVVLVIGILHLCINIHCGKPKLSPELQELADMLHRQCQDETGVAEQLITNANNNDMSDDRTLQCYMKCLMVQMATLDEDDGTLDEEACIAIVPDEYRAQAEPIIKACGTQSGKDLCETAYLTNKCWQSKAPNDYFLA